MSFDRSALATALRAHKRVARMVIAGHKGSTPREAGASMLIWDGGQSGTIGGGTLEYEAVQRALDGPSLRHIPLGPSLGQCCGGAVTLVTEIFEDLAQVPEAGIYRRQITGDAPAPQCDAFWSDGWLSEPLTHPATPLWIWGAGHVGRALVETLAPIPDYQITWIDTTRTRFPDHLPDAVDIAPTPDLAELTIHAPQDAHHLIVTYSHDLDLELCHRLLTRGFASAGLIGSKTKWTRFQSRLKALGHSDAQISRITCPIGDPNLGKHPQAIAVGVAARLLSQRCAIALGKEQHS